MELPSVAPLRKEPRSSTSEDSPAQSRSRLSRVSPLGSSPPKRILDFDLETLAAGYADPAWVPDKITVAAWAWVQHPTETSGVRSLSTGKDGFFSKRIRGERLRPLLEAIDEADILTGHNLLRFDLRVLNAECMRCGLPTLGRQRVEDTIVLPKSKGFKKGQDDMSVTLGNPLRKKTMNWAEWDEAYEEEGWPEVIERCESDVLQHMALREKVRERGLLRTRTWAP